MSRSTAEVFALTGEHFWGIYDGTGCDCVPSALYRSLDDMPSLSRLAMGWRQCDDPTHEHVPARVISHMGDAWDSEACVECACLTGKVAPYPADTGMYGKPDPEGDRQYEKEAHHSDIDLSPFGPDGLLEMASVTTIQQYPGGIDAYYDAKRERELRIIEADLAVWRERVSRPNNELQ